jgi:phosphate transport system substrate-binding protein
MVLTKNAIVLAMTVGLTSGMAHAGSLAGLVKVDGSSTVFPITEAAAEDFGTVEAKVRVTAGVSGTGGGFKKFIKGEIDLCDASRPIKSVEVDAAKAAKINYVAFPVAFDGLSVVVNPSNDWVDHLTVAELKKIWEPDSKVKTWKDIRATWPDRAIKLYGPGTDSGTFDYFTEAINGKAQASRADFTKSEDDNVLVMGVASDKDALGYFGYSYVAGNLKKIKPVAIQGAAKPVAPSEATIMDGTYAPLSRRLFVYANTESLKKPEVYAFLEYYLKNAARFSTEVGYVALPAGEYQKALKELEKFKGSKNAH